jgi:hypothetical protein
MSLNWIRALNLQVGSSGNTVDLSSMRVRFLIRQSSTQSLNPGEFRIYNLSKATAKQIAGPGSEFTHITFSAGYVDNVGAIYQGNIIHSQTGRENPVDTFADLFCRDGDKAYNWGQINKTFAAGSRQRDHVDEILKVMKPFGITEGTIKGLSTAPYTRAVSLYGMARDVMRTICHSNNATWHILNETLNHIPISDPGSGDGFVLNENTGLIGMPVETTSGISVTAFINPAFKVGKKLIIDEASIQRFAWNVNYGDAQRDQLALKALLATNDGTYKIFSIEWRGDTHLTDWYATMLCHGITGNKPFGTENIVGYTG